MDLRYGMNPDRPARATLGAAGSPVRVISGEPSYINLLDALNGWQLVAESSRGLGVAAASSLEHVSPAGAAVVLGCRGGVAAMVP